MSTTKPLSIPGAVPSELSPQSSASTSSSTPSTPPSQPDLMAQIQEARTLMRLGKRNEARMLLQGCIHESTKRTKQGDGSEATRMAHGYALHHLGALYAAVEGQSDQAAYCYLLASNAWPPLARTATENFKLMFAKLSSSAVHHLCSLMNDTERHSRLLGSLESSLASVDENKSSPVLVAGASSPLLAVMIARQMKRSVTVVEDSRVLTLLGKASVEVCGMSKSVSFIDGDTISHIFDEGLPCPFAAFVFDPFPYTFEARPLQILSSMLRHHKSHHSTTTTVAPPALVPNTLVLRAFIVESPALKHLSQVAPEESGIIQGLNLGAVMNALGRSSVPIDAGFFPFKVLSGAEPLAVTLSLEDLADLGQGRSVIHQWERTIELDGQVDAIIWWVEGVMTDGDKEEVLISCDPRSTISAGTEEAAANAGMNDEKKKTAIRDLTSSHLWQTAWLDFESFKVSKGDPLKVEFCLTAQQAPGVGGFTFQWLSREVAPVVDEALAPILDYHLPMINDLERNSAYEKALVEAIERKRREGKELIRVLDIGAGSGLLGMLAARAGADEVVCLEKVEMLAGAANMIVEDNGMAEKVMVINELSTDLSADELGGKFHILVSEIFGDQPLSESVLSTFRHAHAELLAPDALVIPSKLRMVGVIAHIEGLEAYCRFPQEIQTESETADSNPMIDMSAWNSVLNSQISLHLRSYPHQLLCPPTLLGEIDLFQPNIELQGRLEATTTITIPSGEVSPANAVVVWFELDMLAPSTSPTAEEASVPSISTDPNQGLRPHWKQAVYYLPPPPPSSFYPSAAIEFTAGDRVQLVTMYDKDRLKVDVVKAAIPTEVL